MFQQPLPGTAYAFYALLPVVPQQSQTTVEDAGHQA
jgi:hypothetical protein